MKYEVKGLTLDLYGIIIDKELLNALKVTSTKLIEDLNLTLSLNQLVEMWTENYISIERKLLEEKTYLTIFNINLVALNNVLNSLILCNENCLKKYVHRYTKMFYSILKKAQFYHDAYVVLNYLNANKIPFVFISNIDNEILVEVLKNNNHLNIRDRIITSEDVRCYKPNKKIFQVAMNKLNLKANEILHIGDSCLYDIYGAKNVGMRACLLQRNIDWFSNNKCHTDYTVKSVTELIKLLDRLLTDSM